MSQLVKAIRYVKKCNKWLDLGSYPKTKIIQTLDPSNYNGFIGLKTHILIPVGGTYDDNCKKIKLIEHQLKEEDPELGQEFTSDVKGYISLHCQT